MIQTVRKNFPGKYKGKSLNCPSCSNEESPNDSTTHCLDTQEHLATECPAFADIRDDLDLDNDDNLAEFFKED